MFFNTLFVVVQRNQQQSYNVARGQGQNLTRPETPSQANLNAQRAQPLQQNQMRPASAVPAQTMTSSQMQGHPFSAQTPQPLQKNQTRPAALVPGSTLSLSHPLNAQRPQPLQQNQTRQTTTVSGQTSRVQSPQYNAPPIPPFPKRNLDNLLQEPSTSSIYKLPEPLLPLKKEEASGFQLINKPKPTTKPPTYHEITLNWNTYLPMLKASIRDVKDPKFLQFHKELNKTKPLSDIRLSLINNQHLSDVKLIVGDKKEVVYGHKLFLITSSSLFLTHFEYNTEVELIIENVATPVLLEVLTYCYTSQVKITEQNVLDLLNAANNLKVRQLSNICHSFISNQFNEDSIFIIFEKALEQKNEMFEKKCIAFMLNNEEKCFSSKGFFKIGFSSLLDIIGRCKFSNEKNEELIKKWNYGEENMAFVSAKEDPVKDPVKPETKVQNKPAAAAPKIPSLLDLMHLDDPHTTDFVYRDDDNESVVSKDDDRETKTRVFLNGNRNRGVSEFR